MLQEPLQTFPSLPMAKSVYGTPPSARRRQENFFRMLNMSTTTPSLIWPPAPPREKPMHSASPTAITPVWKQACRSLNHCRKRWAAMLNISFYVPMNEGSKLQQIWMRILPKPVNPVKLLPSMINGGGRMKAWKWLTVQVWPAKKEPFISPSVHRNPPWIILKTENLLVRKWISLHISALNTAMICRWIHWITPQWPRQLPHANMILLLLPSNIPKSVHKVSDSVTKSVMKILYLWYWTKTVLPTQHPSSSQPQTASSKPLFRKTAGKCTSAALDRHCSLLPFPFFSVRSSVLVYTFCAAKAVGSPTSYPGLLCVLFRGRRWWYCWWFSTILYLPEYILRDCGLPFFALRSLSAAPCSECLNPVSRL